MKANQTLLRHCAVLLLAALLTYLFLSVHSNWAPMHRWNRAFADASFVLLVAAMIIGPAVRLRSALSRIIPWRRELGIYAVGLGAIHVLIILDGWIGWEIPRIVGLLVHPDLGAYVMAEHGFGLANVLGIVALVYGAMLVTISNEYAVRRLGGSVWKFIQRGTYVLWALVVLHTAYFLFMHFLHFHRPLPELNPLQWPFIGLVLGVITLQSVATVQTWQVKRKAQSRA